MCIKAQIPYFSGTVGDGKLYGYLSLKFRQGINNQETFTCFQYGLDDYVATGVELYTGQNSSYSEVLVRGGYKVNQWSVLHLWLELSTHGSLIKKLILQWVLIAR